ncbi:MAG: class I SAM-dependent methyltransferase [bacterium]|nr:class I SAM-dependent methyltransferase [bacterium]
MVNEDAGTSRKTRPHLFQHTYLLNRELVRTLRSDVAELFPIGSSARILDVGCGRMPYRPLFEGRCAEYVGCDADPAWTDVVDCPAHELAFDAASFDAVVCFQVLEHVPEPWRVLEECCRVLRPGGVLLLTAPFVFPYHPSPGDFYRYTLEGLRHLVTRSGLDPRRVHGQVASLPVLCLLVSWYAWVLAGKLRTWPAGGVLATIVHGLVIGPANAVGWVLGKIPFAADPERACTGFSNHVLIADRP